MKSNKKSLNVWQGSKYVFVEHVFLRLTGGEESTKYSILCLVKIADIV